MFYELAMRYLDGLLPLLMHTIIYTLYCNYIVTGIMYDINISW